MMQRPRTLPRSSGANSWAMVCTLPQTKEPAVCEEREGGVARAASRLVRTCTPRRRSGPRLEGSARSVRGGQRRGSIPSPAPVCASLSMAASQPLNSRAQSVKDSRLPRETVLAGYTLDDLGQLLKVLHR